MIRILVIDDDSYFLEKCCTWLFENHFIPTPCSSVEQAELLLEKQEFEVALIDLMLPPSYETEGLKLLRTIRMRHPDVVPIMISSKSRQMTETAAEAVKGGAYFFLDKRRKSFYSRLEVFLRRAIAEQRRRVFISHGHNDLLKLKLKDFLSSRLGHSPVVLADQPNKGLTVVEKLELVSEKCCFALILMTKDDEQKDGGLRARQNVIHELGFFQGKYGRKNVVLLAERGVELFSNISGIIRIDFEAARFEEIYEPLRIELAASECLQVPD